MVGGGGSGGGARHHITAVDPKGNGDICHVPPPAILAVIFIIITVLAAKLDTE